MAVVDINDDVAQALKALWMATPGLGTADGSGFSAGELKASLPSPQPPTYALIGVAKGRAEERYTGQAWSDYRNVTLTVRGQKPNVVKALALMLATFNRRLVNADMVALSTLVLAPLVPLAVTLPSGARFVRWWPANGGDTAIKETPKSGNEIWRAWITGEVWTIRTET